MLFKLWFQEPGFAGERQTKCYNRESEMGLLKGNMTCGQSSVLVTLSPKFTGAGDSWRSFYFALTSPCLFTSTRIYGGLGGPAGKESACNAGDLGSVPGLGRSPGEGHGNPLQCSGLENSMDCIVHGVTKSRTWLTDFSLSLSEYVSNWSKRPSCGKVLLSYLPFYFSGKLFLGKLVFWVLTVFQYFLALSTLH